jgi:hypothetical protein
MWMIQGKFADYGGRHRSARMTLVQQMAIKLARRIMSRSLFCWTMRCAFDRPSLGSEHAF